ncbi:MAG: hypothetical protein ACI8R4_003108 [Paracoccaceae bacterium]|jgi:hypothetical protein
MERGFLSSRMFSKFPALHFIFFLTACLFTGQAFALGLSGNGTAASVATRDKPLEVAVGIEIDQISFVDQKSENFGVVATIRMDWNDPALAFDPEEYGRAYRIMKRDAFGDYVNSVHTVAPAFVVQNQQSNKWVHQARVVILPNGDARYLEKSSVTLQAPHFNFTRYPFDRQKFYFEVVSILPSELVIYSVMDEFSGLGALLGEEEWVLGNAKMELSTVTGLSGLKSDKVALAFEGTRHGMYYVIRIFLPMLILVVVSWATFFLNEYRKRIELAGANLLVFVAFNWMISDDLPKLGYLTFLDFILQWMFVVTGAIIVFSVGLSRLKSSGREMTAQRVDNYVIKLVYPLGYGAIVGFAVYNYLLVG